jgi:uncharacterized protein YbjT (DUF2867 family)
MKVAVVGGTGVLGRAVVECLLARGDEVVILTRRAPAGEPRLAVDHRAIDLAAADGAALQADLVAALDPVDAVVDAVNSDSRGARAARVLVDGTRRLLLAEEEAGVGHHVAISIIGCDRLPFAYYRVKAEQEEIVRSGGVPWSLLRAAQFHNLLDEAFRQMAKLRLRPSVSVPVQPVEVGLVAERLVEAVHQGPGGDLPELAGPEIRNVSELSRAWAEVRGRRLLPLRVPVLGKAGRALKDGVLCKQEAAAAGHTFEEWIAYG